MEANSTGGQGSRRAVALSGGGGGGDDDDDDDMPIQCQYSVHINSASSVYY